MSIYLSSQKYLYFRTIVNLRTGSELSEKFKYKNTYFSCILNYYILSPPTTN